MTTTQPTSFRRSCSPATAAKFVGNALAFATEAEAKAKDYAASLAAHWTLGCDWEVRPSEEGVSVSVWAA